MMNCATIFGAGVVVVGDPVDVVAGANLDRELDFELAGPLPLPWYRWYSSERNWVPGGHGWGHAHEYEQRLVFDLDGVRFHSPGGTTLFPSLERVGAAAAAGGYRLDRVAARRYTLSQLGRPTAVFELADGRGYAPLTALTGRGRIEFRYDNDGFLQGISANGRPLTVEHDAAGRVRRLSLPAAGGRSRRAAEYDYDPAGNLVKATDPYGNACRYRFDAENRQVGRTDRRGYRFAFEYDAAGRCVRAGGEDGAEEVRLAYDPVLRATLVTRHDSGQWLYVYDENEVVTQVVAPDGGVRRFVTGIAGQVETDLDPLGNPTARLHDPAGGLIGTLDPFGYLHAPDEEDDPHAYRVPGSAAERVFGDLFPWAEIEPPAAGDSTVAALGAVGRYFHTAPPGRTGEPVREEDEFGQLFRESFPDGTARRWVYDPNGNVAKYADREGGVRTFEYASRNARVAELDPIGGRIRYEYAASGVATAVTDPGGTRSEYRYDLADRLVEVRFDGATNESYEHDLGGNLVCKRDGAGGELMRQEIGLGGQPVSRTFATGEAHSFAYDPHGRFLQASTGAFAIAFAYEREFRTADLRDGIGVEHRLGPDGVEETTLFRAYTVGYQWVAPDELAVTDPTGRVHRVRDRGRGFVERVSANGCRDLGQYAPDGRCLGRVVIDPTGRSRARGYRYSPENCLTAAEDSARGDTRYRYDAAHRLIGIDRPDGTDDPVDLDPAGNVVRMPGLHGVTRGTGNRLLAANGESFGYDARGHLATRASPAGTTRYHYNADDVLVRVESPSCPDWTAAYDPFGRRVWKQWAGRRTEFWWDTDRLAAERDDAGRLRVYVYADDFALVPLAFVDYLPGATNPAAGRVYSVHTDQLGTPVEVRDEGGAVVWEAELAPYGAAVIRSHGLELNLRFPGHYFDPETGLHYNRHRYYDPVLGRYLQVDPIGIGGGLNVYAYPSRPLDVVDLFGLAGDNLTASQRRGYNNARGGSPSSARRKESNKPGSRCAATGKKAEPGKSLAADHIVPLKKVAKMPGFDKLSPAQQRAVANNPRNFQPMRGGENSSKGAKEVKNWKKVRGKDIDPARRKAMLRAARRAEKELQAHINRMLKDGKKAPPRKCSRCKQGTA